MLRAGPAQACFLNFAEGAMKLMTIAAALVLASCTASVAQQKDSKPSKNDEKLIKNAMSAAPKAVAKDATVVAMDEKGEMRVLRKGTNNFTCMPDNPASPGNDPMCLDKNGMEWAHAWMTKQQPPKGKIGFGYMLAGGSDASNRDPHAAKPEAGRKWVDTGPHIMIFNFGGAMEGYPTQGDNPDTKQPYVMWGGTPYEHLMIPVK
jgi:hypothetical protein